MNTRIFYSWQSDLPNSTNRGFILKALENAARAIRKDESIAVEPVIERDTAGVPGSPDIASTILEKIDNCQVFVCDVSIVRQGNDVGKATPNPNVLIELGYALKSLGPERIVMVLNTAFGDLDQLPFDLRMRRVLTYDMPKESEGRAPERKSLERTLEEALRLILADVPEEDVSGEDSIPAQAIHAVLGGQADSIRRVREAMTFFSEELSSMAPRFQSGPLDPAPLDQALVDSIAIVDEFVGIARAIAEADSVEAALALYKGFGGILEGYNRARGFRGTYREVDFDFHRFIGHELFVGFISSLIQHNRWEIIARVLDEDLYIENAHGRGPGMVPFTYISTPVALFGLGDRRRELLHWEYLRERHMEGALADVVPLEQFEEADFLLWLRSGAWNAWGAVHMDEVPRYLLEASRVRYAERLLEPLAAGDIDELRQRVSERIACIARTRESPIWAYKALGQFDIQSIGSR